MVKNLAVSPVLISIGSVTECWISINSKDSPEPPSMIGNSTTSGKKQSLNRLLLNTMALNLPPFVIGQTPES